MTHPQVPAGIAALPVAPALPALRAALVSGHAILVSPPGSGKSTGIPLALLDAPWLGSRRMLILQPRRAAARLVALRMAQLLGEVLGQQVGYHIRFERRCGPDTRIEVLTEGMLTRRLQTDPELGDVGLLIFDEFHERHLAADLGLALALDVIGSLRPDLRLLLMSATLDPEILRPVLGEVPIIHGEGVSYPVETQYAATPPPLDPVAAVLPAIRQALREDSGDLLVFLPGAGEIAQTRRALELERWPEGLAAPEVLPLHGSLSSAEQDRALIPAGRDGSAPRRRVILATDLAETSLTIEGIRTVIDSGWARKPRFVSASGVTRLVTERISRAAADQRAGRAGRLGPGRCLRLWTRDQDHQRPAHPTPDMLRVDLAACILEVAVWGTTDPGTLRWVDPPPVESWTQGVELLRQLGALDPQGAVTALGQRMATLPLHPRLAAMLLRASASARPVAADLCALLGERDLLRQETRTAPPADLQPRLHALTAWRCGQAGPELDPRRAAMVARAAKQFLRTIARMEPGEIEDPAWLLALAYPERIGQRSGLEGRYRLAGGGGASLPRDDALTGQELLAIAELSGESAQQRIRLALALAPEALERLFPERIDQREFLAWDPGRAAVIARERQTFERLTLADRPSPIRDRDAAQALLLEQLRADPEACLPWRPAARQLQARVALLRRHQGADWPDWSLERLAAQLEQWLAPWLEGMTRLEQVQTLNLQALLHAQLDWEQRQRLERAAPETFETPAGTRRRIDYVQGEGPRLAVPLQELFGLQETPRICEGRQPLLLELLSPAGRPVQLTQDLSSFWSSGYPQVRKDLRGRYPKHAWPEDPRQAIACPRGLRARRQA